MGDLERGRAGGPAERDIVVSIVIPTFRRDASLAAAVSSCSHQRGIEPACIEIVIVDNSPERFARDLVRRLAASSAVPIRYVSEPRPGISHARNAGLAAAHGAFVAFIDDDEIASPSWLSELLGAQVRFHADVVLGPVVATAPGSAASGREYEAFFTCSHGTETGTPIGSSVTTPFFARERGKAYPRLASGNALLRLGCPALAEARFSPQLGRTGGEDTLFFSQLLADGATAVWCREAVVYEPIPHGRLTLRYLAERAFRGGQTTAFVPLMLRPARRVATALSMAVGAAQLLVYAPAATLAVGLRMRRRIWLTQKAMSALGKLLWMAPFRRTAYG